MPGETQAEAIGRGLEQSGVYLLVLSPAAVESTWVRYETDLAISLAQKREIRFISILLRSGNFPRTWLAYQYVNFQRNYDAGLKELLSRLPAQPAETFQRNVSTTLAGDPIKPAPDVEVQGQAEATADDQRILELRAYIEETLSGVRPSVHSELQLQPVEPFLEQVIDQLKREAPRNVVVSFNSSLPTFSYPIDPPLFEILLSHLIRNAWDAIPDGRDGRVELTLEEYDNRTRIAIRDNGVGISEQNREHIFKPSDNTEQSDKERGRGLVISYWIAKLHDGQLTLGPSDSTGTTFFIDLPANPE